MTAWTREKPTESGLYWYFEHHFVDAECVLVWDTCADPSEPLLVIGHGDDGNDKYLADIKPGWWALAIPPPFRGRLWPSLAERNEDEENDLPTQSYRRRGLLRDIDDLDPSEEQE